MRERLLPLAAIGAASFAVVAPFSWLGIPSGHDFEFHLNSWIEVVDHWKQGVLLPHWAALAHYGYGEARFIFYPPISWTLGGALGLMLPWTIVPAVYMWLALTLAGLSMYLLAKRWLPGRHAVLAAVAYAVSPYHLVIVYWRSAMAELLAAAYLPLLVLLVLRAEDEGRRLLLPLSLLMAAGWLTNVPSAVMMTYSIAVLAVCVAIQRKSPKALPHIAVAVVLGAALAGFYLLPVLHEQGWISLEQVLGPGVRPADNFLFAFGDDPDHNRFNMLVSVIALSQIIILSVLMFLIYRRCRGTKVWWTLLVWFTFCAVLMLRPTLVLWNHFPELRYVQFPWRWLLCMGVPWAWAIVVSFERLWVRVLIYTVALAVVWGAWHRVQAPWWDSAADVREMVDNQQQGTGNEGADEYVPAGIDPYDADQHAPLARFEGPGGAQVRIDKWQAEDRAITVNANSTGKLALRLFHYPSWRTEVNGTRAQAETGPTGQLVISLPAGESSVHVSFVEGWDRSAGAGISLTTLVFLLVWHKRPSRRVEG